MLTLFIVITGISLISFIFCVIKLITIEKSQKNLHKINNLKMIMVFSFFISLGSLTGFITQKRNNSINQFDNGAFISSTVFTADTLWTYRTFVGVEGQEQLVPALVNVYGEKSLRSIVKNDGSTCQWGYTIKVPALTTISSRFQGSLEYTVGPHMISKVFINWSDTSKAEWKNCKKEIQW